MQRISDAVYVADCCLLEAESYARYSPVRPAPLEYPYQAHKTEHLIDTTTSQYSTPGPASTAKAAARGKRKRRSSAAPVATDATELQARERHSTIHAKLQSAVALFQAWLRSQRSARLPDALHGLPGAPVRDQRLR